MSRVVRCLHTQRFMRSERFRRVYEPIVDGSPYKRLLGRVVLETSAYVPSHRLPGINEIKNVDFVQGLSLSRLTVVVPAEVHSSKFLALRKPAPKALCDRCRGKHSVRNHSCAANFLDRSPLQNTALLYNIRTGNAEHRLVSVHVVETWRQVQLCQVTTIPLI